MKKYLLAVLCIALVLSLGACKKDEGSASTTAAGGGGEEVTTTQAEQQEKEIVEFGTPMIYQWMAVGDDPCFEFIIPVKNISDDIAYLRTCHYVLKDKDGKEIYSADFSDCAPMYIDPGQEGIVYMCAMNKTGYDFLDPEYVLEYKAEFINPGWEVTKLDVTVADYYKVLGSTEITGTITNDTDEEYEFPPISFLFYDKDGNILCGAYTSGGNGDYESDDFGKLHPHSSADFTTYRYWMPNDYPLEDVSVEAFGFGVEN